MRQARSQFDTFAKDNELLEVLPLSSLYMAPFPITQLNPFNTTNPFPSPLADGSPHPRPNPSPKLSLFPLVGGKAPGWHRRCIILGLGVLRFEDLQHAHPARVKWE